MDELYDIDGMKCVWGIKSYDDLSGSSDATLWTMNDFDITYLEDEKKYVLSVETIYEFQNCADKCKYLTDILKSFTKWMEDNHYNTQWNPDLYDLFERGINIHTHFDSIEEAYGMFRALVSGYTHNLQSGICA